MSRARTRTIRQCLICQTTFFSKPSEVRDGGGKYCSQHCYHIAINLDRPRKFWANVIKTDTCWLWPSAVKNNGYGPTTLCSHSMSASRAAYILTHGEIPQDLVVRHKCDNPPCVNPDHLELGTQKDNIQDAVKRGRMHRIVVMEAVPRGTAHWHSKLTETQVKNIRTGIYGTNSHKIATLLGVSRQTIDRARSRQSYTMI